MGNVSGQQIGDFQAGVGRLSTDVNVVGAWIVGGFLVLIAAGMAVFALVPSCPLGKENCADEDKKRNLPFLGGLALVPLAALVVWSAKWWQRKTRTSDAAAQVVGTAAEIGALADIFRRR